MPPSYPKYVPKELYVSYLAEYAERLELDVRLGQPVVRIGALDKEWVAETPEQEWRARAVVVATGRHNERRLPLWPGAGAFEGRLLHSEEYRSGGEFAGKRVLVIGIGNTGAEIAADLVEEGAARVAIAVRTPPPITSREIAGIPVQIFGLLLFPFPPRAVDRVGAVLRRIGTGDLRKYGLGKPAWGPFTARRPPVIDVGFLKELKAGRVEVLPEVVGFTRAAVVFRNGAEEEFDVVVAATGFGTALERLLDVPGALDERGYPSANGAHPGLFFAGYSETPRGQLFESNRRARRLAAAVSRYLEAAA